MFKVYLEESMSDESSTNEPSEQADEQLQWVALRIGLAAPPLSIQTPPIRAIYRAKSGNEPLDLVRLDGIAPEIFNLFSGQVQAVLVYVDEEEQSPHHPTSERKFDIALGAGWPEPGPGTLDTGTKQKQAFVAAPVAQFTVLEINALIAALTPPQQ